MTARITTELPDGTKREYVYAYGLTYESQVLDRILGKDLKSHIEKVRDFEVRDDDIYLASYPKCGTHWVWEILVMLKRGNAVYDTKTKEAAFLDFRAPEDVDGLPSPRVLNCHYPCKLTPRGIFEKGIKIVHVMRNPKDACVSMYYHYKLLNKSRNETFREALPLMMGETGVYNFYPWFKYVKEWERFSKQHPQQILNLYFEDIKENPVREIKKINDFLNTNRSDELIEQIAEACDFQNLKKANAEVKVPVKAMKDGKKHLSLYRKGQVGDWKNHFTVSDNEKYDRWLEENLIDTELTFRYTL